MKDKKIVQPTGGWDSAAILEKEMTLKERPFQGMAIDPLLVLYKAGVKQEDKSFAKNELLHRYAELEQKAEEGQRAIEILNKMVRATEGDDNWKIFGVLSCGVTEWKDYQKKEGKP